MKTWPRSSLSRSSKKFLTGALGVLLSASSSLSSAQSTPAAPLEAPKSLKYPGLFESFEGMLRFDEERFDAKATALKSKELKATDLKDLSQIDIDPDFLNSLILNSSPSYLRIAGRDRCALYDALITDLLKTKEGKVERVFVQFRDQEGQNVSAVASKPDFLEKLVYPSCPKTKEEIGRFQIKVIDSTIKAANFEAPNNREQCDYVLNTWLDRNDAPYWCQIHELLTEAAAWEKSPGPRDPAQKKLQEGRLAVARILRGKLSDQQQDFLRNFCTNAASPKRFCDEFFSTNFFAKVADGTKPDVYVREICQAALGKTNWSPALLRECLRRLRDEPDACMWGQYETTGLSPRPRCDHLSLALNSSSLTADYADCPRYSDQQGITNLSRILRHLDPQPVLPMTGMCSAIVAGTVYEFNKRYGNEDQWKGRVCYLDRVEEKERCLPMFYGDYGTTSASLTSVMAEILYRTKGAPKDLRCTVVKQSEWNPNLLQYRYGCHLLVDEHNCGIGNCSMKVMYNEKEIKGIKFQPGLPLDYFPTNLSMEKYSQTYLLTRDANKKMRQITSLTALSSFFATTPKGILHGIGCAEDLLPSFFKKRFFNQCSPLPFIVDGVLSEGDRVVLVTRSGADSLQAPRLISWSLVYSAVKSYQHHHPVKQWTLHAIQ